MIHELTESELKSLTGGKAMYCRVCGYQINSFGEFLWKAPAHVIGTHYSKTFADCFYKWITN